MIPLQFEKPVSEIQESNRQLAEKDEMILQLEADKKELQKEVNQLKTDNATLKSEVVQVNADLMGFMEYYFENQP